MASRARTEAASLSAAIADLPRVQPVDMGTTDRLAAWAKYHLASLSPERRAELEAEWN